MKFNHVKKISKIRMIIPSLLALITGRDRYLPEGIEFSSKSWIYNIFRAWEMIAFRSFGKNGIGDTIRQESSFETWMDEDGILHVNRSFFTLEALLAHTEGIIRQKLSKAFERRPEFGYIPQPVYLTLLILGIRFSIHGDLNGFISPLVGMAIAVDSTGTITYGTGSPVTMSHTNSGSNGALIVGTRQDDGGIRGITGITYAGNAMTQIPTVSPLNFNTGNERISMWSQLAPTGGTNTISVATSPATVDGVSIYSVSYSGVKQSGMPDVSSSNFNSSASGSNTTSLTIATANSWAIVMHGNGNGGGSTAGAGSTIRSKNNAGGLYDSNGALGTGSYSMTVNLGSSDKSGQIMIAIAPAPAAVANTNFFEYMD